MIFLSSDMNLESIDTGRGVASGYSLGSSWIGEWAWKFCDGKCDGVSDASDDVVSFGAVSVEVLLN